MIVEMGAQDKMPRCGDPCPETGRAIGGGMRSQSMDAGPGTVHCLVLDPGEEIVGSLLGFARQRGIRAAQVQGIGAAHDVSLGYFDPRQRAYEEILLPEQVEILALGGNLSLHEGDPRAHLHVVVGLADGSTRGGHLNRGVVRPTLELFVTAFGRMLRRALDDASGLPLLAPGR
jgi:predicted DNA-binding protein with PD1-like motif